MIDVHCHLIYGVDDGPFTIEESINMVSKAQKLGIKTIIATPHHHECLFNTDKILEHFYELVRRTSKYGVSIRLGYEVFIGQPVLNIIKKSNHLTLDNSEFILIELPYDDIPEYTHEILDMLQYQGLKPIISHPERIRSFIKNMDLFMDYFDRGYYMQLEIASIVGVYGNKVKEFAKKLLKNNLVHFIASNAHYSRDYVNWYSKAYNRVKAWVGEEQAEKLFNKNAGMILDSTDSKICKSV